MANHGCINGTVDSDKYSSPVKIIGFYIAAASLLCVALMVHDAAIGFWARKRWLPCKYFKLNSITLAVLTIVAKLPVDLTTSMPSNWDQISKLTGSAVICISMGFLAPSIGVNSESECLSNMVALSIFVITVAANICMQLYTGVIVLFFVEHIIMVVVMLLLLLMLWNISLHIKSDKKIVTDRYNNLLTKGNGSMFGRLKLCHLYAYCSNPQFTISIHPTNAAVSTLCLACSVIVIQAAFRSLLLKQLNFCRGDSDYGISMKFIVVSQLVTVIVGTVTILFRWLSLFSRMDFESIFVSFLPDDDMKQRNMTLRMWSLQRIKKLIVSLNMTFVSIAQLLILIVCPSFLLHYIPGLHKAETWEDFEALPHDCLIAARPFIVRKSVNDIVRLRKVCNKKSLIHLPQLLSQRSTPNINGWDPMTISHQDKRIQVCSLSMALLVKIAQVSIPKNHLGSLPDAFKEAKKIILFIDSVVQPKTSQVGDKFSYAEAVWTGGDFTSLVPHDISAIPAAGTEVEHALAIMTSLKDRLDSGNVWSQLGIVVDFINRKRYSSVQELYNSIEELFVDMLHIILAQLPAAIFKSLRDSPAEEFEEKVQRAMKFLFKTGCLEEIISWSFPREYNISSFVADFESKELTGALAKLQGIVPRGLDQEPMNGAQGV